MNRRTIIAAIPLILVNAVAFAGQFAYIRDHVHWILAGQIAFALALESVALFLAYMSHEALMAEDSAYGLRILSYLFGGIIGAMNYSHYSGTGMRPTFEAVATGLMSISSPFLWGIYSRRNSRDALKARGLIESRAVKLGPLRWILWLRESAGVFRLSVWHGENNPAQAIADWEASRAQHERSEPATEAQEPGAALATARTKADAIRAAIAELGESLAASAVADWLRERGWNVSPGHVRAVRAQVIRSGNTPLYALPSPPEIEPAASEQE